jgi:predicted small metal-binding protein
MLRSATQGVSAVASRSQSLHRPRSFEEAIMARKFIDCREFPSDKNCTVALCADGDEELLEAAVQHAVAVHGHQDTPELRQQISALFKPGTPPLQAPQQVHA